jgi:L-fuculose-phosphate aldolase
MGRLARPGAEAIAKVAAALVTLRLADVHCRISVRSGDAIISTPRLGPGVTPSQLDVDDMVLVDAVGNRIGGTWPAPPGLIQDVELYARRPDVNAVVHAQPPTVLAFAAVGRDLLPLTHTESGLAFPPLPRFGDGRAIAAPEAVDSLVDALGARNAAILTGVGVVAACGSLTESAMLIHQIELLATINAIAAGYAAAGGIAVVTPEDSRRINSQKAPPQDFQQFFDEIAEARPPSTVGHDVSDISDEALRGRIATACRLLYHHGLIEHLEHVSVRLPGRSQFLMTPRRPLGRLPAEAIATVDMGGQWVAGPDEPPPFLWFHRDIFAARRDVSAIVHTHQPFARALAMTDAEFGPLYRGGAHYLRQPAPVYDVPDLMFDPKHRQAAVGLLGENNILHERAHGVDFLAETVEEATVMAVLYERQARLLHLARQLGTPTFLGPAALDTAQQTDASWRDWWAFFLAELPDASGTPTQPPVQR